MMVVSATADASPTQQQPAMVRNGQPGAMHRAKPGQADALEKRMIADARKTREEPGALQFHIHRDRFERNLFVVFEIWRDINALREHFEKLYVKQFVADSVRYHDGDMEVQ
jgi:quinol monooxygenase YgiN